MASRFCRCDFNMISSYKILGTSQIKSFLPFERSPSPEHVHLGAQAIEVLLKTKAFVVKRLPTDEQATSSSDSKGEQRLGQISWGKFGGPANAWSIAVTRAGFPGATEWSGSHCQIFWCNFMIVQVSNLIWTKLILMKQLWVFWHCKASCGVWSAKKLPP